MEAKNSSYDVAESDGRIVEILNSAETFDELNEIPKRDRLTYTNGFYVNCTALFIDIRGSSNLPKIHNRPVLGKIYRSYISECIEIMNGNESCREIFLSGDCVNGIFNTPLKVDIDGVFDTAARLSSLIQLLNWRLECKGYQGIQCGIGIDYGRALMIKAGAKGTGINDLVWMGDVVNRAAKLCHEGNKGGRCMVQLSDAVYENLKVDYAGFCQPVRGVNALLPPIQYECEISNGAMREYLAAERQRKSNNDAIVRVLMAGIAGRNGIR